MNSYLKMHDITLCILESLKKIMKTKEILTEDNFQDHEWDHI